MHQPITDLYAEGFGQQCLWGLVLTYKAFNWFGFSLGDSYSVVATLYRVGGLGLAVGSLCVCVLAVLWVCSGSASSLLCLGNTDSAPDPSLGALGDTRL